MMDPTESERGIKLRVDQKVQFQGKSRKRQPSGKKKKNFDATWHRRLRPRPSIVLRILTAIRHFASQ